jgi:hypothetical protein
MVDSSKETSFDGLDDCDPEVSAQFMKSIDAFAQAKSSQPFEILVRSGISLPSPAELTDSDLKAKLWDVISALALLGVFLEHTDHLSDRELYLLLWGDVLREEMAIQTGNGPMAFHLDLVGSGSESDLEIYLKYYADDEDRLLWQRESPEDMLPDREVLPFDRDRLLPKPNLGRSTEAQ